jgi:hypothetical protein
MQVGMKRSVFANQSFFLFLLIAVMSGVTAFFQSGLFYASELAQHS